MNNQQLRILKMTDNSVGALDREDSPPPSLYPEFPTIETPPCGTKAKNSPKIPHIIRKNVFTAPGFLEKRSNVHKICDVIRAKNAAKSDNNHEFLYPVKVRPYLQKTAYRNDPFKKSDEKSKIGTSNKSGNVLDLKQTENQILSTKPPKYNPKCNCSLCETYRNQNQSSMNCSKNVAYKQIMKNFDESRASEPIQSNRWKTPTNLQAQKINKLPFSRPDLQSNRFSRKQAISRQIQTPSRSTPLQSGQCLRVQNSFPQYPTNGNLVSPNYNTPNPVHHLKTSRASIARLNRALNFFDDMNDGLLKPLGTITRQECNLEGPGEKKYWGPYQKKLEKHCPCNVCMGVKCIKNQKTNPKPATTTAQPNLKPKMNEVQKNKTKEKGTTGQQDWWDVEDDWIEKEWDSRQVINQQDKKQVVNFESLKPVTPIVPVSPVHNTDAPNQKSSSSITDKNEPSKQSKPTINPIIFKIPNIPINRQLRNPSPPPTPSRLSQTQRLTDAVQFSVPIFLKIHKFFRQEEGNISYKRIRACARHLNLAFPEFLVIRRVEQYVWENFPDGVWRV